MKRTVFASLLVVLCGSLVFGQQYTVAVAGFETMGGVTQDELTVVTEVFTTQLASTGVFRMADRRSLDKILSEMQFQASDWSNKEKTAAIGKVLNAHYVIRGQLTRYGQTVYWTARMLDVNTAHALYGVSIYLKDTGEVFEKTTGFCKSLVDQFKVFPPEVLQKLPTVALAGFDVVGGVTSDEATLAAELLMTWLAGTGKVKIADRAGLDKIAQEMQFQASDWSDRKKTAVMGQALNAQTIVRGQIMKMGANIICTATMLDVNTAEILHTARAQVNDMVKVFNSTNTGKRDRNNNDIWDYSALSQVYSQLMADLPLAPPHNPFVGRWQCVLYKNDGNIPNMTCILNFQSNGTVIVERYDTATESYYYTGSAVSRFFDLDSGKTRWSSNRNGKGTGTIALSRRNFFDIDIELSLKLEGIETGLPTQFEKITGSLGLLKNPARFYLHGKGNSNTRELFFLYHQHYSNGSPNSELSGVRASSDYCYSEFTRLD